MIRGDGAASPQVDERLTDGLRYTETIDESGRWRSRRCCLHLDGEEEPVSSLVLHSLSVRFGATALPAEGVGGVQTRPDHQRRGYNERLITRAVRGAKERVPAVFLYGIERYYSRFGFATCLAESSIDLWVRRTKGLSAPADLTVREADEEDLPEMIALYNELHAARPWTLVRDKSMIASLRHRTPWKSRPDVLLFERSGSAVAYAAIAHYPFGWIGRAFTVLEAGARTLADAHALLAEASRRCRELDLEQLTIHEPRDGTIGTACRALGCTVTEHSAPDGGGMGVLLDRQAVVDGLRGELARRAGTPTAAPHGLPATDRLLAPLGSGELVRDDATLLQLLTGYRSWDEALLLGEIERGWESSDPDGLCRRLFPGGSTSALPSPYAHRLDRY